MASEKPVKTASTGSSSPSSTLAPQQLGAAASAAGPATPGQQPAATSSSPDARPSASGRKQLHGSAPPLATVGALAAAAAAVLSFGVLSLRKLLRRGQKASGASGGKGGGSATKGPCSNLKSTSKHVPLADGSACVVRRPIPADNSCLFNAVGYVMHHSKIKANFLRSVVAREVSSDPQQYSDVFLGMSNAAYCSWIMNRANWGGGIEISILAKHYNREISAWNIESAKGLVFGEEAGYPKQVMLIYNGIHYDALAISPGPKASEAEDVTEFNPRTKRGKMIIAAAQKLVELTHRGKKFVSNSPKLKCGDCKVTFGSQGEAVKHAETTGHANFEQVK